MLFRSLTFRLSRKIDRDIRTGRFDTLIGPILHLYREYGIKNGVYKDGSKEANKIMDLTEHLFRENISNAAEQGVVRTKGLDLFKSAILLACALVFLGYLFYHLRKDRKRKDREDFDDTDLF